MAKLWAFFSVQKLIKITKLKCCGICGIIIKKMAYRNNDGCGCFLALIIVMAIISGIRSCTEHLIKGDLELPKFGSGHVSGGSGIYGTSNGYNVKYKHTTSPNSNSSLRDYTHTNNQPTEYRNGRIEHSYNNPTHLQSQSKSYTSTQNPVQSNSSSNIVDEMISDYEKQFTTCSKCKGKGYILKSWTFTGESGNPCVICWKSEKHEHKEQRCYECMGSGKVRIK